MTPAPDCCPACPRRVENARNIYGARIQFCQPTGPTVDPYTGGPAVVFVADGPDSASNGKGQILRGKLGREFDDAYLAAAGLERDGVYCTSACKCMTPHDEPPDLDTARACAEFWLVRELQAIRPRFVVAMGATAARVLLPRDYVGGVDIDTHHGRLFGRVEYTGRAERWVWSVQQPPVLGLPGVHLIVTVSPSSGLAGGDLLTDVLDDFGILRPLMEAVAAGQYPHLIDPYPFPVYREVTNPATVWETLRPEYSSSRGRWVAADTETDGTTGPPWCLSYSTAPGTGWVIPADAREALAAFRAGLHDAEAPGYRRVLLHNALFDLPILHRLGVDGFGWRDTMHTAYQLGNQPQGLKPLGLRLCGMEMVDYTDVVRYPSLPPLLEWGRRVEAAIERAIPTKQPRKRLVLQPEHKFWKKHGGLLKRRVDKVEAWMLEQLFPAEAGGEFPDPWKWWDEREAPVQAALSMFGGGPMPQMSIVHVPRPRAIEYAGRDADATLRVGVALRRMVRQLARTVPPFGDRPRKTW